MIYESETEILSSGGIIEENGKITVRDEQEFRNKGINNLVDTIIAGDNLG